jgi:hypothetical protein
MRRLRRRVKKAAKSPKASKRVTAAEREKRAAASTAQRATRRKAIGASPTDTTSRRQVQKSRGRAIQAHVQARGQRRQAKRDAR